MKADRLWPAALVGVLAVTVAANGALFYAAGQGGAMALEPDYYRRALDWDSARALEARSRALAWQLTAFLGAPAGTGHSALELTVHNAAGAALAGATAGIEGFAIARAGVVVDTTVAFDPAGRAVATLWVRRAEWHEFRVRVARGADTFVVRVRCLPGRSCVGA